MKKSTKRARGKELGTKVIVFEKLDAGEYNVYIQEPATGSERIFLGVVSKGWEDWSFDNQSGFLACKPTCSPLEWGGWKDWYQTREAAVCGVFGLLFEGNDKIKDLLKPLELLIGVEEEPTPTASIITEPTLEPFPDHQAKPSKTQQKIEDLRTQIASAQQAIKDASAKLQEALQELKSVQEEVQQWRSEEQSLEEQAEQEYEDEYIQHRPSRYTKEEIKTLVSFDNSQYH